MSPQRRCPTCQSFASADGCSNRKCPEWRGRRRTATTPLRPPPTTQPQHQAISASPPIPETEPGERPRSVTMLTPSTGTEPRKPSPRQRLAAWTTAVDVVMREPIPRPGPSGRCPKCHQPEAVGLGALGFHLCRGDVADGARHFFELVDGLVGNH